jgi:hypothetical protein
LLVLALVKGGILGKPKVLSVTHAMNGALAGMVSICSGVDKMYPWAAAITGLGGGISYLLMHMAVGRIRIDDPLDAVAVHFGGGMWGLIAAPFLMKNGIILTGTTASIKVLGWNLAGAVSIITWSGTLAFIMFGLLKYANVLRVEAEVEMKGLDLVKHNEPAYPAESWFEEQYQRMNTHLKRRQSSVTAFDVCLPPHMRMAKKSLDHIYNSNLPPSNGMTNKAFVTDESGLPGVPAEDVNNHTTNL